MISTTLDKCDGKTRHELRSVFTASFKEPWARSCPFPRDPVHMACNSGGEILGFVMTHSCPPYQFPAGPGAYMYNLCVRPNARRKGVAARLIEHVKSLHPTVHSHMILTDPYHAWFTKQGFVPQGKWRGMREYSYSRNGVQKIADPPAGAAARPTVSDDMIVYLP